MDTPDPKKEYRRLRWKESGGWSAFEPKKLGATTAASILTAVYIPTEAAVKAAIAVGVPLVQGVLTLGWRYLFAAPFALHQKAAQNLSETETARDARIRDIEAARDERIQRIEADRDGRISLLSAAHDIRIKELETERDDLKAAIDNRPQPRLYLQYDGPPVRGFSQAPGPTPPLSIHNETMVAAKNLRFDAVDLGQGMTMQAFPISALGPMTAAELTLNVSDGDDTERSGIGYALGKANFQALLLDESLDAATDQSWKMKCHYQDSEGNPFTKTFTLTLKGDTRRIEV